MNRVERLIRGAAHGRRAAAGRVQQHSHCTGLAGKRPVGPRSCRRAYLVGDSRVAGVEFDLARRELASTGRADQVALAVLTRCAVRVASLDVGPCEEFDALRPDASAAERAYADYLANRVQAQDIALLPAQHRPIAAPGLSGDAAVAALQAIDDPLARLIATSVLFQGGRANPAAIALAVETASDQGWRRPLLAWLGVQLALAEKSGDTAGAEQLRRRIALAGGP